MSLDFIGGIIEAVCSLFELDSLAKETRPTSRFYRYRHAIRIVILIVAIPLGCLGVLALLVWLFG